MESVWPGPESTNSLIPRQFSLCFLLAQVQSAHGTYLANTLLGGISIRSVITYNKGGEWHAITAPEVDQYGQPTNCLPVSMDSCMYMYLSVTLGSNILRSDIIGTDLISCELSSSKGIFLEVTFFKETFYFLEGYFLGSGFLGNDSLRSDFPGSSFL